MAQHPNKSHTFVKGVRLSELVIGFVIKRLGSATPKELPICLHVTAMAAAVPDWESGIPSIAVMVIGEFNIPNPMPKKI